MFRQRSEWLYLPDGYLPLLSRLIGPYMISISPIVWNWQHGGPGPYIVPAWRLADKFFIPPMLPPTFTDCWFIASGVTCFLMMLGFRQKILLLLPISVLAYFGPRDFWACGSHFIVMCFCYLVALLFQHPGKPSCSRRLIQVSIFLCYFLSAVQKILYPDYLLGYSMEAEFKDGWGLAEFWGRLIAPLNLPHWLFFLASIGSIILELFVAFGLFSKRLRKYALAAGIAFHLVILIFFNIFISWFSIVMFIGYLAFIDKKDESSTAIQDTNPPSLAEALWALCYLLVITAIPLRIYLRPDQLATLSMLDRTPWSFCMFLDREEPKSLDIRYKGGDNIWHQYTPAPTDRTKDTKSDSDIYSLSSYIFHKYPEAQEVRIELELSVNKRAKKFKSLHAFRSSTPELNVRIEP